VKTACLLAFCFFFGTHVVGALDIDAFEKKVRQWLDLRQELGRVKNEWQEQKELLTDELRMLERQKEGLAKVVETDRNRVQDLEKALDEGRREKDAYASALEKLHPCLLRAENSLKPWQRRLPFFMLQPLAETFKKLPESGAPKTPSDLAQRIRTVISLYSQLEQLNCSIHAEKLIIRDPEGNEREMDVVFLGMAIGFAVSPDNALAAVGHVTAEGVIWNWDPGLAGAVRHAWSCYQKEKPAAFVDLPVDVEDREP
jgi:hypothetical protein